MEVEYLIMFQHILVPTDGSELSWNTAIKSLEFAKGIGAKVTFLHALPDSPQMFFGGEGTLVEQALPEELDAEADIQAHALLTRLNEQAKATGVQSGILLLRGAPYEVIIHAATSQGCDLILMASHGYRGIKGLILGSETQKVLTHTKIPVLVYR